MAVALLLALVLLLGLYVGLVGPIAAYADAHTGTIADRAGRIVYAPLIWLSHENETIQGWLVGYQRWWESMLGF